MSSQSSNVFLKNISNIESSLLKSQKIFDEKLPIQIYFLPKFNSQIRPLNEYSFNDTLDYSNQKPTKSVA